MQRIQDVSAVTTRPAIPTLTGSVGFFTDGTPGTQEPTVVPDWWLNMTQEEMIAFLTAAGLPLDGSANLLQAASFIGTRAISFVNSGTWVVPAGVYRVKIRLYGGGGGGGYGNSAGGGGGGGGGYVEGWFSVTPGNTLTITIGGTGTLGTSTAAAGAGGNSTVYNGAGELCYATGGQPGAAGTNGGLGAGGAPGLGAGTPYATYGSVGGAGSSTSSVILGGQGGDAFGYQGGPLTMLPFGNNGPGNNAQTGAGGSGGIGMGNGGNGGSGLCVVEY